MEEKINKKKMIEMEDLVKNIIPNIKRREELYSKAGKSDPSPARKRVEKKIKEKGLLSKEIDKDSFWNFPKGISKTREYQKELKKFLRE